MQKSSPKKEIFKPQPQKQPGKEFKMDPNPEFDDGRPGNNKLEGKKTLITGGDSGIGRAVAVAFAKEGADVAIIYLPSEEIDARNTSEYISKNYKRECLLVPADISREANCKKAVAKVLKSFSKVDVLVNNAAVQFPVDDITQITSENLLHTFSVNILAMFWITRELAGLMKKDDCIINTTSVTAYRGHHNLIDYSSTKGAIVTFTRSMASNLASKGIRVNAVAPGPIWTPLIPASFPPDHVEKFGTDSPLGRPGQPVEVAPAYVYLACKDSSYVTGQVLHVNGGEIVNG